MTVIGEGEVVRITASISRSQERALKELALKNKVSLAWLIRYAVDQLIEQGNHTQLPLDLTRRA